MRVKNKAQKQHGVLFYLYINKSPALYKAPNPKPEAQKNEQRNNCKLGFKNFF